MKNYLYTSNQTKINQIFSPKDPKSGDWNGKRIGILIAGGFLGFLACSLLNGIVFGTHDIVKWSFSKKTNIESGSVEEKINTVSLPTVHNFPSPLQTQEKSKKTPKKPKPATPPPSPLETQTRPIFPKIPLQFVIPNAEEAEANLLEQTCTDLSSQAIGWEKGNLNFSIEHLLFLLEQLEGDFMFKEELQRSSIRMDEPCRFLSLSITEIENKMLELTLSEFVERLDSHDGRFLNGSGPLHDEYERIEQDLQQCLTSVLSEEENTLELFIKIYNVLMNLIIFKNELERLSAIFNPEYKQGKELQALVPKINCANKYRAAVQIHQKIEQLEEEYKGLFNFTKNFSLTEASFEKILLLIQQHVQSSSAMCKENFGPIVFLLEKSMLPKQRKLQYLNTIKSIKIINSKKHLLIKHHKCFEKLKKQFAIQQENILESMEQLLEGYPVQDNLEEEVEVEERSPLMDKECISSEEDTATILDHPLEELPKSRIPLIPLQKVITQYQSLILQAISTFPPSKEANKLIEEVEKNTIFEIQKILKNTIKNITKDDLEKFPEKILGILEKLNKKTDINEDDLQVFTEDDQLQNFSLNIVKILHKQRKQIVARINEMNQYLTTVSFDHEVRSEIRADRFTRKQDQGT